MKAVVVFALWSAVQLTSYAGNATSQCRDAQIPKKCHARPGIQSFGLPPWNDGYLEGQGLERKHFTPGQFPPAAGASLTSADPCDSSSKPLTLTVVHCTNPARGAVICRVFVKDGQVCGSSDSVSVVVVKGYWDGSGTWQDDSNAVTLSCASNSGANQSPRNDGSITSCVELGYYPDASSGHGKFEACIRAVRADYCGDGTPRTLGGTLMTMHDDTVNKMSVEQCADFALKYEAVWNKDGAVCVSHSRWTGEEMDALCSNPGALSKAKKSSPRKNAPQQKPDCSGVAVTGSMVATRSRCNTCPASDTSDGDCSVAESDPICPAPNAKAAAVNHPSSRK